MNRYFFDTANGDNDVDQVGVELPDDPAAVREAVRYAGSMIADQPELLQEDRVLTVRAREGASRTVAAVRIELLRS